MAATKRKSNLAPMAKAGSAGYDVVIGARKKHFDSHAQAYRHGVSQQNKGVHAEFVIVDNATRKRESFKRSGAKNPKRNPESGAIAMREKFTGLPSKGSVTVTEDIHVHEHLAALGELIEMKVKTIKGGLFTIGFTKERNPKRKSVMTRTKGWIDRRFKALSSIGKSMATTWINPRKANPRGDVLLCCSEDGKNLFCVGGNQEISLSDLGLKDLAGKESVVVGQILTVTYHATKDFGEGKETFDYEHEFSEESKGPRPTLRYSAVDRKCHIDGGVFTIPKPLLGTSGGITD